MVATPGTIRRVFNIEAPWSLSWGWPERAPVRPAWQAASAHGAMHFDRHVVIPAARLLLLDGEPVKLGARAFDLLIVLLRARGRVVSKKTMMEQVWPEVHVGEGSLRFQIVTLRKLLGGAGSAIMSVSGRGYIFVDAPDRESVLTGPHAQRDAAACLVRKSRM